MECLHCPSWPHPNFEIFRYLAKLIYRWSNSAVTLGPFLNIGKLRFFCTSDPYIRRNHIQSNHWSHSSITCRTLTIATHLTFLFPSDDIVSIIRFLWLKHPNRFDGPTSQKNTTVWETMVPGEAIFPFLTGNQFVALVLSKSHSLGRRVHVWLTAGPVGFRWGEMVWAVGWGGEEYHTFL